MSGRSVLARLTVAGALTALLLAGCGGGDGATAPEGGGETTAATEAPATQAPTTEAPTGQAAAGTEGGTVAVTEKEFAIQLPQEALSPGDYTFQVTNEGTFPHDLVIEGPGVDEARTEVLQPGSTGEVTVTLQAGTYEVWCSVGNHREQGMDLEVTVG